jgi:general secretion pathway protein G
MCNNPANSRESQLRFPDEGLAAWKGRIQLPERGFVLLELIAAMTILLVLASMAVPLARVQVVRSREIELRHDLREMREAIDNYKRWSDGAFVPVKVDSHGYPPDLQTLVEGVPTRLNPNMKYKFLRQIPIDPMTGSKDWGLRSVQDDLDSKEWGGQNVFDVFSKSDRTALDGTPYAEW